MSIETELSEEEVSQLNSMKTETSEEPKEPKEPTEESKETDAPLAAETTEPADQPTEPVEEKAEEPKEEPKVKTVPHGAFHEERMRRKQAEKEIQDLREKFARADERIKALAEKKENIPDPNEDPLGYEAYERQRINNELSEKYKTQEQEFQSLRTKQEQLELKTYIDSQERVFQADHPDYNSALKHLVETRMSVMDDMGVEEEERLPLVQQEFTDIANRAIKAGKNPAEAVYKMAQKMGYKKVEKKPEKNIESIKKGVEASRSLSGSGKSNVPLTAEALASMSDEEWEKFDYDDFSKVMRG